MAYEQFDPATPDGLTQTGPEITPAIRANQAALADAIIIGDIPDWNMTVAVGPVEQPQVIEYYYAADQTQRLRRTITWNFEGNPETQYLERSYDGETYEEIGTKTITYSDDGAVVAINWS